MNWHTDPVRELRPATTRTVLLFLIQETHRLRAEWLEFSPMKLEKELRMTSRVLALELRRLQRAGAIEVDAEGGIRVKWAESITASVTIRPSRPVKRSGTD